MLSSKHCIVSHTKIHYLDNEKHNVPVLVFLHGWGCSANIFKNLFPAFNKDFRVVALDFPGFGNSELLSVFSVEDYKNILFQFLQKLNIELQETHFITHSFGGRVAIKFCAEYQVASLTLINSGGIYVPSYAVKILGKLAKIGKFLGLSFLKPLFYKLFVREADALDALKNEIFQETYKKVVTEDLQKHAPKIQTPTLLLWGEQDNSTPLWHGKMWAKILPHAQFFSHTGDHFFFLKNIDWVVSHILRFLQDKKI